MKKEYYGIYDRVAKSYCYIGESKNDDTFARMCAIMAKDEKTFLGQAPEDYKGYHLATFDDENGEFKSIEPEKVWEGNPHE
nr:DNA binding protein [Microvirus sp.]